MEAIKLVAGALAPSISTDNPPAAIILKDAMLREKLALASLYSSIASVSTGFGAAHSLGISVASISASSHCEICAAFLPAVFDQYASLVEQDDENESMVFLGKLMQAILEILNLASNRNDPTLSTWFANALDVYNLADAQQLGFDDSMVKSVVDNATKRLEDATKTNTLFYRRDIHDIVQSGVRTT